MGPGIELGGFIEGIHTWPSVLFSGPKCSFSFRFRLILWFVTLCDLLICPNVCLCSQGWLEPCTVEFQDEGTMANRQKRFTQQHHPLGSQVPQVLASL